LVFLVTVSGCGARIQTVSTSFDKQRPSSTPDYALESHWAALPQLRDAADSVPRQSGFHNAQADAKVDVFFVNPTSTPESRVPTIRGMPM
jgi:hypothetical protein